LTGTSFAGHLPSYQTACPRNRGRVTSTPNDDREYFVACRADGLFLIDATPARHEVRPGSIPGSNLVHWFPENDVDVPGLDQGLQDLLNGFPVNGLPTAPTYCPGQTTSYYWTSQHTPNREALVFYDPPPSDRFTIYSVNKYRAGIWVIALDRVAGILVPSGTPSQWRRPTTVGSQTVGPGHTISLDQTNRLLFVADETTGHLRAFPLLAAIGSNPPLPGTQVWQYMATVGPFSAGIHDSLVKDGKLYASVWGSTNITPRVDVFSLEVIS
jgi:hypothetical protein